MESSASTEHALSRDNTEPVLSGKALILQSATRLLANKGFHGVSMREIADASQMTKAALYYHFKDKEDLLREIFSSYLLEFEENMHDIKNQIKSARQRICELVEYIMTESPERLSVIHLIFIESQHLDSDFRQEIGEQYHNLFLGNLEKIISDAVKQNEIVATDPKLATQILFGMMYLYFHPHQQKSLTEMHRASQLILHIFFEGLQTSPDDA